MNELQLLNTLKWVVNNKDAEIAQELGDAMKKIFPNTGFANKINTALTAKARPTTQVSANKNYKVLDLTGIEKKKVEDVAVVKELPQQNLVGDTFDTFKTTSDIDSDLQNNRKCTNCFRSIYMLRTQRGHFLAFLCMLYHLQT